MGRKTQDVFGKNGTSRQRTEPRRPLIAHSALCDAGVGTKGLSEPEKGRRGLGTRSEPERGRGVEKTSDVSGMP